MCPLARDADVAFEHGLRVVVGFAPFDVGDFAEQVELADEIRFAVVKVNGFGIDQLGGTDGIDVGDDRVLGRRGPPGSPRLASTMLNVLSLMWRRLTPTAGFWPPAK